MTINGFIRALDASSLGNAIVTIGSLINGEFEEIEIPVSRKQISEMRIGETVSIDIKTGEGWK